jgi:pyruvate/2-oxoglutarate dehydrogenase complex dihydrolipoamide acyltransferase (E2) component
MSDRGAREIRVPQLGEGLREARIVQLLRTPGTPLRRGDPIYVIETDKTTVELEAPFDGTLLEWHVAVGDVVAIDATVALVANAGAPLAAPSPKAARVIPPRTRAHALERGLDDHALAAIPSVTNKLLPEDVDKYLAERAAESREVEGMRERRVTGGHRAVIFRLRRSATLVIPGTLGIDVPWSGLEPVPGAEGAARPTPFQIFAHAVARVAGAHPKFRSVMVGDDRIREYDHVNLGIALARPNDELIIAVVRRAEAMQVPEFIRACARGMRAAIREGAEAADDTQILLTHLGEFGVVDAVPTLVAPASSIFFLGAPQQPAGNVRIAVTFDHRLINGAAAARFLDDLAETLRTRTRG